MEEPEEYVVEEKLHFISKRVEAEPAIGILTLMLILSLHWHVAFFTFYYS
jgi:hypothetical protein